MNVKKNYSVVRGVNLLVSLNPRETKDENFFDETNYLKIDEKTMDKDINSGIIACKKQIINFNNNYSADRWAYFFGSLNPKEINDENFFEKTNNSKNDEKTTNNDIISGTVAGENYIIDLKTNYSSDRGANFLVSLNPYEKNDEIFFVETNNFKNIEKTMNKDTNSSTNDGEKQIINLKYNHFAERRANLLVSLNPKEKNDENFFRKNE